MKSELEKNDIEAIAQRVVELLTPILIENRNTNSSDKIFTVKQLSEYLSLSSSWIYNNIHKIPHFDKKENRSKRKGKPLFRRSEIDCWLEDFKKEPATQTLTQAVFREQTKKEAVSL